MLKMLRRLRGNVIYESAFVDMIATLRGRLDLVEDILSAGIPDSPEHLVALGHAFEEYQKNRSDLIHASNALSDFAKKASKIAKRK